MKDEILNYIAFIFLLLDFIFFVIGLGILINGNLLGLPLLLFGILFFALFYLIHFYYPEIQKREAENKKNRYQEELRRKYGDLYLNIVEYIKKFKPLFISYDSEILYHIDLARWLEAKYPMLKVEFQLGSAQPDIVIEDIAIEIKGPTYEEDLWSIVDKFIRYHHHFNKMIVVLFDIRTKTNRFYTEWENEMKRNFPNVMIIRK